MNKETNHSGEFSSKWQCTKNDGLVYSVVPCAELQLVEHYIVGQGRVKDDVLQNHSQTEHQTIICAVENLNN